MKDIEDKEVLVKWLAYDFSEINVIYPFREGKGHAQREFVRKLAIFVCKYEKMESLFEKALR